MKVRMPHCELKWEIPIKTQEVIEMTIDMHCHLQVKEFRNENAAALIPRRGAPPNWEQRENQPIRLTALIRS